MKHYVLIVLVWVVFVSGCNDRGNRRPIGQNYEVEIVGGDSVLHTPANVRLYYVSPEKKEERLWSYIVGRTPVVLDDLIVFNGGLSDEKRWGVYPALLACQKAGPPVEISKALSRKTAENAEYSFRLVNVTNGTIHVWGVQQPPPDTSKSLNVHFQLSRAEILAAIEEARKRSEKKRYGRVDYYVEP